MKHYTSLLILRTQKYIKIAERRPVGRPRKNVIYLTPEQDIISGNDVFRVLIKSIIMTEIF